MNQKELSNLLSITPSAISIWKKSNPDFEACYEGNKINQEKLIKHFYERIKELEDRNNSDNSEKKKKWDAYKSEIQVKLMTSELVNKHEYIQTEVERFLIIKQAILELPERLQTPLALSDEQKGLINNICRSILEETKKTFINKSKEWINRLIESSSIVEEKDNEE